MKIVKFEFSLFGINTYVVIDSDTLDCAIIDPGIINAQEFEAMKNFISSNNLHPVLIINTHLHIDHAIGNSALKKEYGIINAAHDDDALLGERISQQAQMFGLPDNEGPVGIDHSLKAGDTIKIGHSQLEVIHVPGHSPGSIALYDKTDGFVISGDALFNGSIGRTDLPGGSHSQLLQSIQQNLFTLPDSTIVYPGHGPTTTIGQEKTNNPFFKR